MSDPSMRDQYLKAMEELATSYGIPKAETEKLMHDLMKDYGDHVCDDYCHFCDTGRMTYE